MRRRANGRSDTRRSDRSHGPRSEPCWDGEKFYHPGNRRRPKARRGDRFRRARAADQNLKKSARKQTAKGSRWEEWLGRFGPCANSSTSRALHSSWTEASRGDCISPGHVIIQRSEKCNTAVNRPVFLGQQGARQVSLLCRRRPAAAQRPARVLGRPTGGSRQGTGSRRSGSIAGDSTPSSSCLIFASGLRSWPDAACRRRGPPAGELASIRRQMAHLERDRRSWGAAAGAGPASIGVRHGVRLERRAVSDRIQEAIEERVEAVTGIQDRRGPRRASGRRGGLLSCVPSWRGSRRS